MSSFGIDSISIGEIFDDDSVEQIFVVDFLIGKSSFSAVDEDKEKSFLLFFTDWSFTPKKSSGSSGGFRFLGNGEVHLCPHLASHSRQRVQYWP